MATLREVEAEYQAAKRRAIGLGKRRLKKAEAALRDRDDLSEMEMARLRAYRWVLANWGVKVDALRDAAA